MGRNFVHATTLCSRQNIVYWIEKLVKGRDPVTPNEITEASSPSTSLLHLPQFRGEIGHQSIRPSPDWRPTELQIVVCRGRSRGLSRGSSPPHPALPSLCRTEHLLGTRKVPVKSKQQKQQQQAVAPAPETTTMIRRRYHGEMSQHEVVKIWRIWPEGHGRTSDFINSSPHEPMLEILFSFVAFVPTPYPVVGETGSVRRGAGGFSWDKLRHRRRDYPLRQLLMPTFTIP